MYTSRSLQNYHVTTTITMIIFITHPHSEECNVDKGIPSACLLAC